MIILETKTNRKCLQNQNSTLYLIPEFKEIYDKTVKPNELELDKSKEEDKQIDIDIESSKHYDDNVVFKFYGTILGKNKLPEKGRG